MSEEEAGRACRYEQFEKIAQGKKCGLYCSSAPQRGSGRDIFVSADTWEFCQRLGGDVTEKRFYYTTASVCRKGRHSCVLEEKKIPWREDITNQDTAYQRNWIRKELLPLLKENLNPGAVRHIADAADDIGKWRGVHP